MTEDAQHEPLGRHHPTIRRLRALRRDASQRRAEGVFLAEGIHLALEALRNHAAVELVVLSARIRDTPEGNRLFESIRESGLPWQETSDRILEGLQDTRSPQPVLTLVRRATPEADAGLRSESSPALAVVAHGVQDPGNLGSIWRTADAAGATALIVTDGTADPYHPRVIRASMGSVFRLPVHQRGGEALSVELQRYGLRQVGADVRGTTDYHAADLDGPIAVWLGGEADGLPETIASDLDRRVRVPMRPGVDSLSVGAAAAVILFEIARQRGAAG